MTFTSLEHANATARRDHLVAVADRHRLAALARSARRQRAETPPPRPDPVVAAVTTGADGNNSEADRRYAVSR